MRSPSDEPYSLRVPARRRPRVGAVLPRGELRSARSEVRKAAIPRLSAVLRSTTDPEIAGEARRALEQLVGDTDPKVAAAAKRALELSD